ncbi:MAG: M3 family metallopeptidase [Pseudanabaenaceae cyanobacterium]
MTNPLLIGKGIPPYPEIRPDQVEPAVTQLLTELTSELEQLEQKLEQQAVPTWQDLVPPLETISDRIGWTWGLVEHLLSVKNSPELRAAHSQVQPAVVQFFNRFSQSRPIYEAYKRLRHSPGWESLDPAQQRIIENAIRDAELSGVGLAGTAKERFNQIQMELAEIATQFANHVLDATKAFSLTLYSKEEVAGLPESLLQLAAQNARLHGEPEATPAEGPWCITLDAPSYIPFMQHSQRADLREKVYKAYISRASSGELDNTPLIERTLQLRQEKAKLLGFHTYAELSLARKMAGTVDAVAKLLEELRQASYPAAQADLEEIKQFAGVSELQHWDIAYWSERLREHKFQFTAEELRPYFPLPQVLAGLFGLVQRLFNVTIVPADGEAPVWHEDVRFFHIQDEQGETIASFFLDPYSRPQEKRGGAWMNDCQGRAKTGEGLRLPIAYLVCNQTPPVDGKPSLMTFNEVVTLFHEFGHGLHHMLTKVDYASAAGINNVEWDAVELPSQFMENWCYERKTLMGMARHYQTGEPLPEIYYQKLLAARNFMSGSAMLRQLHFALVDLHLHHYYQPDGTSSAEAVRRQLAETTMVMPPLAEDRFLCSFSHIFAGGYAAGYYSYKWAEVLSADAFSAFEEVGLENEEKVVEIGRKYRDTVLALGGSQHPLAIFKAFRGREPSTVPLLKHSGLLKSA